MPSEQYDVGRTGPSSGISIRRYGPRTNPASRSAATGSRARWQPPASGGYTVRSSARWVSRMARPPPLPCSKNRTSPPGRSTRRNSASARGTSRTLHSTRETTTASNASLLTGRASAAPGATSTGTRARSADSTARERSRRSGSMATTSATVSG